MSHYKTISILFLALVASLLIATSCQAAKDPKEAAKEASPTVIGSKPVKWHQQARSRSARSLNDMFEKVKSKIFGSKKASSAAQPAASQQQAAAASASQPATTIQSAAAASQRQPWDVNSYNQQFNAFQAAQNNPSGAYQWPSVSGIGSANTFMNGAQFGGGFSSSGNQAYPGLTSAQIQGASPMVADPTLGQISGVGIQTIPSSQGQAQAGSSGLLSSASQLISQYLSPGAANNGQSGSQIQSVVSNPQQQQQAGPQQQPQQSLLSQNQQNQYNEFASMLDSMVAQTGLSAPAQRQQFGNVQQQQQQNIGGGAQQSSGPYQQQMNNMLGGLGSDNDMMASSNVQILAQPGAPMPSQVNPSSGSSAGSSVVASSSLAMNPQSSSQGNLQPQASQKSSMVSLAEQLAPGAQFNKLISFPFSLSNNDDPNKEGKFKLHIPFLNQHVKRSDQQQQQPSSSIGKQQQIQQQQNQQFYNQYYSSLNNQQPSVSSISSSSQQLPAPGVLASNPQSSPISSSSPSSSSSVSSSSAAISQQQSPSGSPASVAAASRPTWSVADIQSSSSSSKMVPIQHVVPSPSSSSSSSVDSSPSSSSSLSSSSVISSSASVSSQS